MSDLTYRQARGVVWRLGPDRVLLHRIGVLPAEAALELSGPVALVWIALDEPGNADEIVERVSEGHADFGLDRDSAICDVQRLVDAGVVVVAEP